jgi:hypothetical protein
MSRRMLAAIIGLVLVAILGALGVWAVVNRFQERAQDETRELSVKVPPRRIVVPGSQDVAIRLDVETQQRLGVLTEPVQSLRRQQRLRLLGLTVEVPQRAAEVRSPWTGILQPPPEGRWPTVGERLTQGQVLGVLSVQWSPTDRIQLAGQLWEVQGSRGETEAEIEVARQAVERLRRVTDGALAAKQAIAAAGELARLEARLQALHAREKTLQDALANEDSPLSWSLAAPQGGQLTGLPHRVGEVVTAGDVIATLYDPSELWVCAGARPGQLDPGAIPNEADIVVPGFGAERLAAQLVQIKPHSDPAQQALEIVYRCPNPEGRIPVGLQAEVQLEVGPPRALLSVPQSAVLQHHDQRLVYVQRNAEEFVKQIVQVEDEDAQRVYLRPTLPAHAKVVRQGAQVLLSEEFKEAIQLVEETGGSGSSEP